MITNAVNIFETTMYRCEIALYRFTPAPAAVLCTTSGCAVTINMCMNCQAKCSCRRCPNTLGLLSVGSASSKVFAWLRVTNHALYAGVSASLSVSVTESE